MTNDAAGSQNDGSRPEIVVVDPATTAVIHGVVATTELENFYDSSFRTLPAVLASQQISILGPAFGAYFRPPDETAELEVGFVTDRAVQPEGDVVASSLPGGRVARMIHVGAFDDLGASWGRLVRWVAEQGMTPGSLLWEVYLTEPSPDMDPRDLRTELNCPISD